jgi:hypothetical protein
MRHPMLGAMPMLALSAALVSADQLVAQSGIYELRCRGAEGLFAIDGPAVTGSDTLHLNFLPSSRASGADGRGLDAGTCAWIDRLFRDGEPGQIYFTSTADVAGHLNDSTRYWSFWVYNTYRGYFEAKRNEAWVPPRPYQTERPGDVAAQPKPGIEPAPKPDVIVTEPANPRDPIQRQVDPLPKRERPFEGKPSQQTELVLTLGAPTVTPTFHGVIIAFKARLNAPATVAIGTGTPAGEPKQLPVTIVQLNAQQSSKSTGKVGDFLVAYPELEQGKPYSYLITVPTLDGAVRQRSGTFTTLGQRARVVFTYITVQSDSDEDSSGDLWFRIAAVSEDPKARSLGYAEVGQIGSPIQWESGSRRKVSAEFTVENAPYRLRLLVMGVDDDRKIPEISTPVSELEWTGVPGFGNSWEWNYAKGELDLNQVPAKGGSIPFTIRSMASTSARQSFAFDVSGYIEVDRP